MDTRCMGASLATRMTSGSALTMRVSVDDPAFPDPLGVPPGDALDISPRNCGGGPFGGGRGGGSGDSDVAPLVDVLGEVFAALLILLVLGGPFGVGMQKHINRSKSSGGRLAIARIA